MAKLPRFIFLAAVSAFLAVAGCGAPEDRATRDRSDTLLSEPADTGTATLESRLAHGGRMYLDFCASCHGIDGRGEGPVAEFIAVPVPDLTLIEARNDGVYPSEMVYKVIEGTEEVRGHGSRDMPVWGNVWGEEEGQPVRLEVVEARINELVEYIRTLQSEEADTLQVAPT